MNNNYNYLRNFLANLGANPGILDTTKNNPIVNSTLNNLQFQAQILGQQESVSQNSYKNALNSLGIGMQQARMNLNARTNIRGFNGGLANILTSTMNDSNVAKAQNIQNNYELQQLQGITQGNQIANQVNELESANKDSGE